VAAIAIDSEVRRFVMILSLIFKISYPALHAVRVNPMTVFYASQAPSVSLA
jgi:hypothetical protein